MQYYTLQMLCLLMVITTLTHIFARIAFHHQSVP